MSAYKTALRVGIGGPVGAGKTSLTEMLCRALSEKISMAVITNDIYTREDADFLLHAQALPSARIRGVETGGCPHTAIREDASINLAAIDDLEKEFTDLQLILLESGGDNLSATFSPELVDLTIYVIDVAMGGDIIRKKAPAILKSDFLLINKIDLAPYCHVDLPLMQQQTAQIRGDNPYIFAKMRDGLTHKCEGLSAIIDFLKKDGGLVIDENE